MRRVGALETRLDRIQLRDLVRIHLARAPGDVVVGDQPVDRVVDVIGIAQVFGTIGENTLFHFSDEMDVLR